MASEHRVHILCEDRLSERLLRRLCDAHHVRVLDVKLAPSSIGSASAWVKKQYPALVRLRRAKKHQQNLGLLVHIDGDNVSGGI